MNQQRARELQLKAEETAFTFSNPERGGNPSAEVFQVDRIIVLGEVTAAVVFYKNTGKKAVAFYYYVNRRVDPEWRYFFVTYAHLASLNKVGELLFDIEQHNYQVSQRASEFLERNPSEESSGGLSRESPQ